MHTKRRSIIDVSKIPGMPNSEVFCRNCQKLQKAFTPLRVPGNAINIDNQRAPRPVTTVCAVCGYYHIRKRLTERQRQEVFAADRHQCVYCGTTAEALTVDHVIGVQWGGTDDSSNLVSACQSCNLKRRKRGANYPASFGRFSK